MTATIPTPETWAYSLWAQLNQDHGLLCTEGDLQDIINAAEPFTDAAKQLTAAQAENAVLRDALSDAYPLCISFAHIQSKGLEPHPVHTEILGKIRAALAQEGKGL